MALNVKFSYLDTKTSSRKTKWYNSHYLRIGVFCKLCKSTNQNINSGLSLFCSISACLFVDFNNISYQRHNMFYTYVFYILVFLSTLLFKGYYNNESALSCCYRRTLSCCGIKQTSLAQNQPRIKCRYKLLLHYWKLI